MYSPPEERLAQFEFLITTLSTAKNAAAFNPVAAREIFKKLMDPVGIPAFYKEGDLIKTLDRQWFQMPEFWTSRADLEERQGNFLDAVDFYEEASNHMTCLVDMQQIRESYALFQLRFGEKFGPQNPIDISDEEEPDHDIDAYLNDSSYPQLNTSFSDIPTPMMIPVKESTAEKVKIEKGAPGIVSMLAGLKLIESKSKNAIPVDEEDNVFSLNHNKNYDPSASKKVGVPVSNKGANVTVLTPVKASKKLQNELGVEYVITPVRRSLRFHDNDSYVASPHKMDIEEEKPKLPEDVKKTH